MSGMHYNYPDSQYLTDPLQMHSVTAAAFVVAFFWRDGAKDLLGDFSGRRIL